MPSAGALQLAAAAADAAAAVPAEAVDASAATTPRMTPSAVAARFFIWNFPPWWVEPCDVVEPVLLRGQAPSPHDHTRSRVGRQP